MYFSQTSSIINLLQKLQLLLKIITYKFVYKCVFHLLKGSSIFNFFFFFQSSESFNSIKTYIQKYMQELNFKYRFAFYLPMRNKNPAFPVLEAFIPLLIIELRI